MDVFGSSVQDGSTCIMRESNMVKKIYFPREVIPISTVTSAFINMILTFVVVFIVLLISEEELIWLHYYIFLL